MRLRVAKDDLKKILFFIPKHLLMTFIPNYLPAERKLSKPFFCDLHHKKSKQQNTKIIYINNLNSNIYYDSYIYYVTYMHPITRKRKQIEYSA